RSTVVPRKDTCEFPSYPRPGAQVLDIHDWSKGRDALHRVAQHDAAPLDPTMGLEGIRDHPKHPIRKQAEPRQKVDEAQGVRKAIVGRGIKQTQTIEDRSQRNSALEIE